MKKHIRNFLILTALATVTIHLINKMISVSSIVKNLLRTDHGKFYDWKYGRIFYTKSGKGSPVLLIHDLNPVSSSQEWERIYKPLSKKHTVYTLDLLGCGRSDKPNLTYTNYMYVQLITDFIKNIIGEKTSLISTGASCSFSIMACNMEPEQFENLILLNPEDLGKLVEMPSKKKNALKFLIDMPIFGTFIYNMIYSGKAVENLLKEKYYSDDQLLPDATVDAYYESAHLANSNGKYLFSSIISNYTNINVAYALGKIKNPMYIICSKENDRAKDIIDSYSNYNASIESACVEHSKYLPQLEIPEKLLEYVEKFLATQ